jgi:hypothetical protein
METAISNIIDRYNPLLLDDKYHMLFSTGINDVKTMFLYYPKEVMPTLRFLALNYHNFFCKSDPFNILKKGKAFEDKNFEAIFEPDIPKGYEHREGLKLFNQYVSKLSQSVCNYFKLDGNSKIGSRRFITHILDAYNASSLLPHNSKNILDMWVLSTENLLEREG